MPAAQYDNNKMILKEKITYHANFQFKPYRRIVDGKIKWFTIWTLQNEKIQLDTGEYFTLAKAVDQKHIFKDLTKLGYGSKTAEQQAFKRIITSHKLEWILNGCTYSWQEISGMLTLFITNIEFNKHSVDSNVGKRVHDNKWTNAYGPFIVIRYERADSQNQAILYHEFIDRDININKKHPTMHHAGELMKKENRKRTIKVND